MNMLLDVMPPTEPSYKLSLELSQSELNSLTMIIGSIGFEPTLLGTKICAELYELIEKYNKDHRRLKSMYLEFAQSVLQ
jgi:hypothetical protein